MSIFLQKLLSALKKTPKIILFVILIGLVLRAVAPSLVKHFVLKSSREYIPQYELSIGDVDLFFLVGRYDFENLVVRKKGSVQSAPLIEIARLGTGISWHHLMRGKLRMNVDLLNPKVTFTDSPQAREKQTGFEESLQAWGNMLRVIVPLEIVSLQIHNGVLQFENRSAEPPVAIALGQVNAEFRDISFTDMSMEKVRPSPFRLKSILQNHATLELEGSLIKKPEALGDLNLVLQKLDLRQLNPFFHHYLSLDFTEGRYDMFGEMKVNFDQVKIDDSYARVFFSNVDVIATNETFSGFKELAIEFATAIGNGILKKRENRKVTDVAFEASLVGPFKKPKFSIGSAFWSAIEHRFADPIPRELKNSISLEPERRDKRRTE